MCNAVFFPVHLPAQGKVHILSQVSQKGLASGQVPEIRV